LCICSEAFSISSTIPLYSSDVIYDLPLRNTGTNLPAGESYSVGWDIPALNMGAYKIIVKVWKSGTPSGCLDGTYEDYWVY